MHKIQPNWVVPAEYNMYSILYIGAIYILKTWIFWWLTCFSKRGDPRVHPCQIWCQKMHNFNNWLHYFWRVLFCQQIFPEWQSGMLFKHIQYVKLIKISLWDSYCSSSVKCYFYLSLPRFDDFTCAKNLPYTLGQF